MADDSSFHTDARLSALERLPPELLSLIFGRSLALVTSTRERLNDLCSLSLVSRTLSLPAQAALYSDAAIRAEGRASLLLAVLERNPHLPPMVTALQWTMFTPKASPALLARLLDLSSPTLSSLCIGDGFFSRPSQPSKVTLLNDALYNLKDSLKSFTFGSFESSFTGAHTSSDYVSHLFTRWHALTRLELRNVAFIDMPQDTRGITPSPLLANTQWRKYTTAPAFRLQHLAIVWTSGRRGNVSDVEEDSPWRDLHNHDWLSWLLSGSHSSLTSLKLVGLSRSLPPSSLETLCSLSRNILHLTITDYTGHELPADLLLGHAYKLQSLTLGGEVAHVKTPDGSPADTLATDACLKNKLDLRFLEIHGSILFDRLEVTRKLKDGQLPALRQINLLSASRVYLPVQRLVQYCRDTDISVLVRPPLAHGSVWEL